jgi:hypothetical protein
MRITHPPFSVASENNPIKEPYFAINSYLEAATSVCAQMTLEKWRHRLTTADLYTEGHCSTAIVELMID